jgi:multisubunit Na+/H+ antiporter MnhC subunit
MAVPVAVWRIAVLDRVPDAMFVMSAIVIGVATVCTFLFGLMPSSLARLRTFLHASVDHQTADSSR